MYQYNSKADEPMLKPQKCLTLRAYLDSYQSIQHSKSSSFLTVQQGSPIQKVESELFKKIGEKLQNIKKQLSAHDINKIRTLTLRHIFDLQSLLDTLLKKFKSIEDQINCSRVTKNHSHNHKHALKSESAFRRCSLESEVPLANLKNCNHTQPSSQFMIASLPILDLQLSNRAIPSLQDKTPPSHTCKTEALNQRLNHSPQQFLSSSAGLKPTFCSDSHLERQIYDHDNESIIYVVTSPKP